MSPFSQRVVKLADVQREQAHALQVKIDSERQAAEDRRHGWEQAKVSYLKDGDIDRLRAEAQVFYNAEPFFSIQQAIVNVAVEVAALAGERATRVILERQTPRIEVGPNDIVATGGLIKRGAVLPLLGDPGPSPRPYGEPTVLDYPTVIPENDCA